MYGSGAKRLVTVLLLVAAAPAGAEEAAKMAAELARLRGEVEALSAELEAKKEGLRAQLRSLAAQKTDLEIELQKEELRLKQLRQAKAQQRARLAEDESLRQILQPVASEGIARLKSSVGTGLPFQTEERQAELDKLDGQLEAGLLPAPTVVARLWQSVEDELRLCRENGLYRQVVRVAGEELLVDVARVGMTMLYFRTKDGRFGRAIKGAQGWSYRLFERPEQREQVALLFDALKKRIRVGFFELPNALPPAEVQ